MKPQDDFFERQARRGHWLPPKRWKRRLYGLFGLEAPDRWIPPRITEKKAF